MSDSSPIVIKKVKKGGAHGGHGGAWKVAYADFVTAMMAFFLVMWVVGLSESKRRDIAGYFREPGVFSFTTGKALPVDPHGEGAERSGSATSTMEGAGAPSPINNALPKLAQKRRMADAAKEIHDQLEKLARKDPEMRTILASVTLEITNEGLRIELAESRDVAYFDVGGAEPSHAARNILAALAPKLAKLENPLAIEGHTDQRPYSKGAGYTNWELSADRANAARKILEENGISEEQLTGVAGYGAQRLRKPSEPFDVANRRVSIIVRYVESDDPEPPPPG